MKRELLLVTLLLITSSPKAADERLNPGYPRTATYSIGSNGGWPTYSIGTRDLKLSQYDMTLIYGTKSEYGEYLGRRLRQLKPDLVLIAMVENGLWFGDPPEFYLYRAYRGHLLNNIVPGQSRFAVDSAAGINQGTEGYRFTYGVVNNDVIDVQDVDGNEIITTGDIDDFYGVSARHAAGDILLSPLRLAGPGVMPNFSKWTPAVDGKYVWDYLAEKILLNNNIWTLGIFDGIFHDAFYDNVYLQSQTMDMDLNGVNDYEEFGSTPDKANEYYINPHRREYMKLWIAKELELMQQLAPDRPNMLSVNAGGTLETFKDQMNGHMYEGFLRWSNWYYLKDDCLEWKQANESYGRPSNMFIEDYIPEKWTNNGKDRFDKMRYGLTTALLFDCYYGMAFGDFYYITFWYDEFETDLGYGTAAPVELPNGLWMRTFDKGVAVCNPTGSSQVISPSDLDGRIYYRLRGGQDPETNNGEIFDAPIEIYGHTYSSNDKRGDGIILFTEPTTAVSDIIIDNFYNNDTSPGNHPVELEGDWNRYVAKGDLDFSRNNPYWCQMSNKQVVMEYDEAYGYHATKSGNGEAKATWRPSIGVAGYYEIAEWHGWHGDTPDSYEEASNVTYTLVINGEEKKRSVFDQRKNYGRWNSLGNYYLEKGQESYLQITNKANGWVIADAVRFRFLGENIEPDTQPPVPPNNLKIVE
ncbi:hypothetical protein JW998_11040 [candidate division KSB1 bacterium]|nr:hypothetical protein [candidate division KSB1 bacterium]